MSEKKQSWWSRVFNRQEKQYVSTVVTLNATTDPEWVFTFDETNPTKTARASTWVYACLDKIMSSAMAVPVAVSPKGHAAEKLFKEPIPSKPIGFWLGTLAMMLKLDATVYLLKVRANALGTTPDGRGVVKELLPIPQAQLRVKTSKAGLREVVTGYESLDRKIQFSVDDIIPISLPSPVNSFKGLAAADACQRDISVDNQAAEWQNNSLRNRAIPDGIFTATQYISKEQREEFEADIRNRWTNLQKNHQPFLLGGDAKFEPLSKTAVELDLINGRRFSREAIASAFGVPVVLLDGGTATYANYETARLLLFELTTWPLITLILDGCQISLQRDYVTPFELSVVYAEVDAMLPSLNIKLDIAKKMRDLGATTKNINAFLGLDL